MKYPLASAASLIADPGRAAMLATLLDGRQLPAGELARAANLSPQSASMHLAKLVAGGLVRVHPEGRHRYYSLANPEVANAIEALGSISVSDNRVTRRLHPDLCFARSCYDHLAGKLAVDLTTAFERRGLLTVVSEVEYALTPAGNEFFGTLEIDAASLRHTRRVFAKRCIDWTERRPHIAGALGAALFFRMLNLRWITRECASRTVHVSPLGHRPIADLIR